MKKKNDLQHQVIEAILACQDKQAEDVTVLELEKDSGAFTDYFVMCSGTNPRQIQAIADAVDERLEALGLRVNSLRGLQTGGVGAARLCGFRGPRFLREGAPVL
jgi:ribosome-associated protein